MTSQFLSAPRRVTRYLVIAAVALAVIAVAGLCLQTVFSHKTSASAAAPATGPTSGRATGIGSDGAAAPGTQKPLQLVAGKNYAGGVSTGYPDTLTGAVSAGVEYASVLGSTLSPQTAAAVSQAIADPSYRAAGAQAVQGVADSRHDMDLAPAGPVPQGASLSFDPSEYQLRDQAPGRVTVLLLGDVTETAASGSTQVLLAVIPVPLHWADGDWKLLAPDTSVTYTGLSASPGTQAAASLGWQPIAF